MNPDDYVAMLVAKYAVDNESGSAAYNAASALIPSLRSWAGDYLLDVTYSGSFAKGTATSLGTDVDLLVSLRRDVEWSMKDTYYNLCLFLYGRQFQPIRRNVALSVHFEGIWIHLVPTRTDQESRHFSLYRSRNDTWLQTNVGEHIKLVATSGRTTEMRALKIWRARHRLEFPSFYLELTVLAALKGCPPGRPGQNFKRVLEYLSGAFLDTEVIDPANPKNVISDDLSPAEKRNIAVIAQKSVKTSCWEATLW